MQDRQWLCKLERVVDWVVFVGSNGGVDQSGADEMIEDFSKYIKGCAANAYMARFDNPYLIECVQRDTFDEYQYLRSDLDKIGMGLDKFKEKLSQYFTESVSRYGSWAALFSVLWGHWTANTEKSLDLDKLVQRFANALSDVTGKLTQLGNQPSYAIHLTNVEY
jgi:hypothetical protein